MKKKRLIPIVLLRNGWVVQSKGFHEYKNLGNPFMSVKRLSEWASDELIYLDITRDGEYDLRRDDLRDPNRHDILEIIEDVSKMACMPITFGGRIRTIQDIEKRLFRGADKISINTQALREPSFITNAAKEFGAQCIVVSIDAKLENGKYIVMAEGGKVPTKYEASEWAKIVENYGAGEILINSIDRDGKKSGFEIPLLCSVADAVHIPVIGCGGAGAWEHFGEVFDETRVDAVAAANIFQHVDQSVHLAKKYLYDHNYPVRPPEFFEVS
ncbi:hypothetical protein A2773_02800 [Candidatus Gottesmanbacteria bacterium RIFCSPHIGHO2_01_FULL_39_10]|uniref:imidazole glycerol-phosphate synthase n=1 Tax=Candidatus Gottesmanbacteria bacterium RIFCSPHIGHO2_01_FULL_39_10 TaxID=1798375 RepID=A0A1F5ZPB7_9BACT|nr:MAG: hypothetical protein A2773_02800 [Candidatus Gottesmanbacteria bacterium RIFCSPHIGHO2_01_FULL_39_10]